MRFLVLLGSLVTVVFCFSHGFAVAGPKPEGAPTPQGNSPSPPEKQAVVEYGKTIQAAHALWSEGKAVQARELLDGTRRDLRGWEWNYVHRLLDASQEADSAPDGADRGPDSRTNAEALILKGHSNGLVSAMFGPRGESVVTGSGDCTARVWDAATGAERVRIVGTGFNSCYASVSQDGSRILTTNHWIVKTWDPKTGELQRDLTPLLGLQKYWPVPFDGAISPDAKRILTCSPVFDLNVRDAATGEALVTLKGHTYWPNSSAFSPDGTRVISGCQVDDAARVWDSKTGEELLALTGHGRGVWSVCFAPDGRRIATGGANGTVHVWDAKTGDELLSFVGHDRVVTAVAFSPDRSRILTGSQDRTARLWDARSGVELLVLRGHGDIVNAAAFSPDGSRIVTACWDKTARIWDSRPLRAPGS